MISFSTFIVHSHEITADGEPRNEYKPRLDRAIELLKSDIQQNAVVLLTWGKATQWVDIRHCDAGKLYLEKWWIDSSRIHIERDPHGSLETVYEAISAFVNHENILRETDAIHLISSDYHKRRIMEIQKFVLWEAALISKLRFVGIDKSLHGNPRTQEAEEWSLQAFQRTFEGIQAWDIPAIQERLWKRHPVYKDHPSNPYKTY